MAIETELKLLSLYFKVVKSILNEEFCLIYVICEKALNKKMAWEQKDTS